LLSISDDGITAFCMALPMTNYVVYRRCRMLWHASSRELEGGTITTVLHWLPVRQRFAFNLAVLTFKALNGLVPLYLPDDYQLVTATGRRHLRPLSIQTWTLQHACDIGPYTASTYSQSIKISGWIAAKTTLLVYMTDTNC